MPGHAVMRVTRIIVSHFAFTRMSTQHCAMLARGRAGGFTLAGWVDDGLRRLPVPRGDQAVDVLSSRILLRPSDPERSRRFYRDILGLAIYREFGPPDHPGLVFFLGQGLLEVSGMAPAQPPGPLRIWLQVRDVCTEHERLLTAGVTIAREPRTEPWGLIEMWIEDPDGVLIGLVEVPDDHPLRRDTRDQNRWLHGHADE